MTVKNIILIFILLSNLCLFGQGGKSYQDLNWRKRHWLSFSDSVDVQSEEWKNLPVKVIHQLMQIPDDEMMTMSTNDLIQTYTDCYYTRRFYLYNEIKTYYAMVYRNFNGARELLNRKDVVEQTISYYSKLDPTGETVSPAGISVLHQIQFMEYLIGNPMLIDICTPEQLRSLATALLEKSQLILTLGLDWYANSNIYAISQILINTGDGETAMRQNQVADRDVVLLRNTGIVFNTELINTINDAATDYLNNSN